MEDFTRVCFSMMVFLLRIFLTVFLWQPRVLAISEFGTPCLCSVWTVICLYIFSIKILVFHPPSGVTTNIYRCTLLFLTYAHFNSLFNNLPSVYKFRLANRSR